MFVELITALVKFLPERFIVTHAPGSAVINWLFSTRLNLLSGGKRCLRKRLALVRRQRAERCERNRFEPVEKLLMWPSIHAMHPWNVISAKGDKRTGRSVISALQCRNFPYVHSVAKPSV
ncbi:hypothetical protein QQF64_000577 [Cirrhinus molitorella]|uniref:Uncharacterized protein n=1 Tax=Cirrhinus molitorella TaxID=172907 RepID=A0ABR3NXJ6_9TELE